MGLGASSGNRATREAGQQELERQDRINRGEARVNAIFDSPARQAQQTDFIAALRDMFQTQLGRQQADASRRLKFANARSGNIGGSVGRDTGRRLGEEFNEGLVRAESQAQDAGAQLRLQDEDARADLLSMVRAGGDATSAATRAANLMRSNAQGAMSRATVKGLGDVFGDTTATYMRAEEAAARRRGMRDAQTSLYAKPFGG